MDTALPFFLGIGVQKGGTTTLNTLLRQHPLIHLPPKKELHYFSYNYDKPLSWYIGHWGVADTSKVRGEITPYYIFHPYAHKRILDNLPEVRLIILLRDPVRRTLSHYFHAKRLGFEALKLKDALMAENDRLAGASLRLAIPGSRDVYHQENSYLSRSRYECQLPRWISCFSPDSILILRSEYLFARPAEAWEKIQRFLSIPVIPLPSNGLARANAGKNEAAAVPLDISRQIRMRLSQTYDFLDEMGLGWHSSLSS
jgi:hypothetical protein